MQRMTQGFGAIEKVSEPPPRRTQHAVGGADCMLDSIGNAIHPVLTPKPIIEAMRAEPPTRFGPVSLAPEFDLRHQMVLPGAACEVGLLGMGMTHS
jgi:hypothetical protein